MQLEKKLNDYEVQTCANNAKQEVELTNEVGCQVDVVEIEKDS